MPAPKLYDLSKARLIHNIHLLEDIGDLPYHFLRSVLRHVQSPKQLLLLEQNCPQIKGEDGEIWLRFIKRDIPNWSEHLNVDEEQKDWAETYARLEKQAEDIKQQQKVELKAKMQAIKDSRAGNQTKIVEGKVGYNPAIRARASRFGGGGAWSGPRAPASTGKMAFDKLKRGIFYQRKLRPQTPHMPAHVLAQRQAPINAVPERLVRIHEANLSSRLRDPTPVTHSSSPRPAARKPDAASPPATRKLLNSNKPTNTDNTFKTRPAEPERPSLPPGSNFSAPKPRPQTTTAPARKRRREEPDLFIARKR